MPCKNIVTTITRKDKTYPKHISEILAEYLGETMMIFADCGDRSYKWLPIHDVAGSDNQNSCIATLRCPEINSLVCCSLSMAQLMMIKCEQQNEKQQDHSNKTTWYNRAQSLKQLKRFEASEKKTPGCFLLSLGHLQTKTQSQHIANARSSNENHLLQTASLKRAVTGTEKHMPSTVVKTQMKKIKTLRD